MVLHSSIYLTNDLLVDISLIQQLELKEHLIPHTESLLSLSLFRHLSLVRKSLKYSLSKIKGDIGTGRANDFPSLLENRK